MMKLEAIWNKYNGQVSTILKEVFGNGYDSFYNAAVRNVGTGF
jgi:hypothetical protein